MQNLIDKIKYSLIWLSRINDSRGFGVQSPSAYSFIRYVINEHYPYYSYLDLKTAFPDLSWKDRKLFELYFRISNFAQSECWLILGDAHDALKCYIEAGCNSSKVYIDDNLFDYSRILLVREILSDNIIEWFATTAPKDSILIYEDINSSEISKKQWLKLISDKRTGCSYDLYYCGILFKDTAKLKQHYRVNF